jgi:SnoaL-like protein
MSGEQSTIEACTQLMAAAARFNDEGRFADLADLFTPRGRFGRPGVVVEGREAILADFNRHQRRPYLRTLHFLSVPYFTEVSTDRASSITYGYFHHREGSGLDSAWDGTTFATQIFHDVFARTEEGWRFAARDVEPVYVHDEGVRQRMLTKPCAPRAAMGL